MAEATQYMFSFKEIVELLVKQQNIHEGLWCLRIEFGLAAININAIEGSTEIIPAALIPVKAMGIQKGTEINALTVDAALVNPKVVKEKNK